MKKAVILLLFSTLYSLLSTGYSCAAEDAWTLRLQGYHYQQKGDYTKAIEYYKKAIKDQPNEPAFYNDLGVAYEGKGDGKNAEKAYLNAIEIDPNYLKAHTNLACLYELQKNYVDAAYHWKKRSELGSPDDPWTNKAKERFENTPKEALDELSRREEAYALEEESRILAQELALQKAEELARQEEEHRLKEERKKVEDAQKLRSQGYQHQLAGESAKAIDYYKKAIKLNSGEPSFYNDLGIAYEYKGDLKNAEKAYLEALEIDSGYLKAHTNLGYLYERQKNYADAAYHWEKRAELGSPDDPWTKRAKERLNQMPLAVLEQ